MPIYKISSRRNSGKRARTAFVRTRLLALLLSAGLAVGTFLLLLHAAHR